MHLLVKPTVSIILLTKNGGELFKTCLNAIFSQDINLTYEVIVVDSGSTDNTLKYISEYPIQLFKIDPKHFRFGPTRDYAFAQAAGQYLVTLSQDVVPANSDWLAKIIAPLIADTADVVQGLTIIPDHKDSYNRDIFFWEKKACFTSQVKETNLLKNTEIFLFPVVALPLKKKYGQRLALATH